MSRTILSAALKSGIGRVRANNEDAYYFNGSFPELKDMDRETSLRHSCREDSALFAVCDGMGGYENGEIASYTAVSRMPDLQRALKSNEFSAAVSQWVEETNQAVSKAAKDGGCTLALLFFHSEKVYIAHIGDSRIYRYCQNKLVRMTKDHSKMQVLLDAGILTEKEAETYPQRHVITRALGMNEEENGKCIPSVQKPMPAADGDRYVICSDGVTDMLSDEQIESLLNSSKSAADCADAVYQAALDSGGKDNTTIIVIDLELNDQESGGNAGNKDSSESTWTPELKITGPVSIEQLTTIKQANGQDVTIKTHISSSQLSGLFPLN